MSGVGTKPPRGYFLPAERIESQMERELARAQLLPTDANLVVDVEKFVESHLGARLEQYEDLGAGVLGQTEFHGNDAPTIRIDRGLTECAFDDPETPPGAAGRWRATVAHEAAHIIFHRALFGGATLSLFDGPGEAPLLRCATEAVMFRRGGTDWREIQANMGMAALLMPQTIFSRIVREAFRARLGSLPTLAEAEALVPQLADRFGVSKQAFRIRLQTLGLVSDGRQFEL